MSGSVVRSSPAVWRQFEASREADHIADDMREQVSAMKCAAELMSVYPADSEERKKGRIAARQFLTLCDEMERITEFFG